MASAEIDPPHRAPARTAALVVAAVVLVEYAARHLLARALPRITSLDVNDMLASGAAYVVLSLVVLRLLGVPTPRSTLAAEARAWQPWVASAACVLAISLFCLVDRALWGSIKLPTFLLPVNATVLAPHASWVTPLTLLLVNGVVIPIAEEWLWRGVVQPRLVTALGVAAGIALTSLLFSLKHAVVDASLGRLLGITAGGVVLGLLARRFSWRASSIAHVPMNTVATAMVLLTRPTCLSPAPEISPDLRAAVERTVALMQAPDPAAAERLFSPSYLRRFPPGEVVAFMNDVQKTSGRCAWRCPVKIDGPRRVTGLLTCDKGPTHLTVGIENGQEGRVNYLLVRPDLDP